MGNIIGESLTPYVGNQINRRQEIYGSGTPDNARTLEQISYLNTKTSWIKLASGTSMKKKRLKQLDSDNSMFTDEEGPALAKKNVLFGGLSSLSGNNLKSLQGIEDTKGAYGIGGKAFGFSPMPGIVDASIKSLNRGSLKKATISIKAHNKNQLDIIDVLYMRLGYTVLLEWGNDKYIDNDLGNLTPMGPTLIEKEWFDEGNDNNDYSVWLPKIEDFRREKDGNYEAMFGVISNFSWTFERDGSYSVKIDIMSMGDIIESLKTNIPISGNIKEGRAGGKSVDDLRESVKEVRQPTISKMADSSKIDKATFKKRYANKKGWIVADNPKGDMIKAAEDAGYYRFTANKFINYITKLESGGESGEHMTEDRKRKLKEVGKYYKNGKLTNFLYFDDNYVNEWWYFILESEVLWEIAMGGPKKTETTPSGKPKVKTFKDDQKKHTETVEVEQEAIESYIDQQVTRLKESKLSYLLFSIEEIAMQFRKGESGGGSLPINLVEGELKIIGGTLDTSDWVKEQLLQLKFPIDSETSSVGIGFGEIDLFYTNVTSGDYPQAYYIRFGKLLEYLQDSIFPKMVPSNKSYMEIDYDTESNIMYTIPNQISTNPEVCLIRNSTTYNNDRKTFFYNAEEYIGRAGDINYGKVMNIYLNFDYIKNLLTSEGIVTKISIYRFLSNICNDINDSLGGVNNLEPIVDEAKNKIVILEQTKIPGIEAIAEELGITLSDIQIPELEIFGYEGKKSNFIRNIGLTTAITKEYSSMITLGATAGGYVPGSEATAFSRWNEGIEDRFKTQLKDGDSDSKDPVNNFEQDNLAIKQKYSNYLNQYAQEMVGLVHKEEDETEEQSEADTLIVDKEKVKINTSAVVNFNRYLQASASLAHPNPEDVETSVGFLPFNLSLTMDGIGGFKIYNKLKVNTKFLPSNYEESMDFVITGVDHKISNNSWETSLNTIGISTGTKNPSNVTIINELPSPTRPKSQPESGGQARTHKPPPDAEELKRAKRRIKILRILDDGKQTLGIMQVYKEDGIEEEYELKTVELPYLGNRNNISCIPPGKYLCRPRNTAKFGNHFHILGSKADDGKFTKIPNNNTSHRGWCLIHRAANSTYLAGCIGPGTKFNTNVSVHTEKNNYGKGGIAGNVAGNPYGLISITDSIETMKRLANTLWKAGDPRQGSFYMDIVNSSDLKKKGTPKQLSKLGIKPTMGR